MWSHDHLFRTREAGGTLGSAPRDFVPALGFRETPDGATLGLGTYRWVRAWVVGVAVFAGLALGMLLLMLSFSSGSTPSGENAVLLLLPSILLFAAFAVAIAISVALKAGSWSLAVDESGLRLTRGRHRPRDMAWPQISRIRCGPLAVQVSRYKSDLAEGIWIEMRSRVTRRVDTARFRVLADDLDRMATVIRGIAERHAVPIEPFPMMGRERM